MKLKQTALLILALVAAISLTSCSIEINEEPSMDEISGLFYSDLPSDTEYSYYDNQTTEVSPQSVYLNNLDKEKTEWFFDYQSTDGSNEIAVVKVKRESYLNPAKDILENHLKESFDVSSDDYNSAKETESTVFIYQKYVVLFKGDNVDRLKNLFFSAKQINSTAQTSTILNSSNVVEFE